MNLHKCAYATRLSAEGSVISKLYFKSALNVVDVKNRGAKYISTHQD